MSQSLARGLGMVIPTWYPADADPDLVQELLSLTLDGADAYCRPGAVALVLDGQERWQPLVRRAAEVGGFRYLYIPENLGKGGAVAAGIEALEGEGLDFIGTRDSDGDHRLHDLPSLLQLAEQMAAETGNPLLIVSGGRTDRMRPLGLERAEYEGLTDRVLWQALQFQAAGAGRQIGSAYFAAYGDRPDIQSGYKLYSREAARMAADSLKAASRSGRNGGLARCGVETIPAVEILAAGGEIGVVTRRTSQGQPVSGYRGIDAVTMYAEPLLWALRRLEVPGDAAAAMLDGALLRSSLPFDYERRAKALEVRAHVLDGLGGGPAMVWGGRSF